MGGRHPTASASDCILCWKKVPGPGNTYQNLCPSAGKGQLALGPGTVPGKVWKAWAETSREGVRKGSQGCGDLSLLSWTLLTPKGYSFLHLQNTFLKWKTT